MRKLIPVFIILVLVVNFKLFGQTVSSITRTDSDPTNASTVNFTVVFASATTGVTTSNFVVDAVGSSGVIGTPTTSDGITWTVPVETIVGDGTLSIDFVTDAEIPTTANFDAGDVYTIDQTTPAVSDIVLVGASPTNANAVDFLVTFNETVTGVEIADFVIATTGGITGESVTGVTGSDDSYTITVSTGTGDGTITIDFDFDASTGVTDVAGNVSDADFSGANLYTIDKTASLVTDVSSTTADGTYGVGDDIEITVMFDESVTVTGTPQLTLKTGTTDRAADYDTGSGSDELTFIYTVQAGDNSADLEYVNANALSLNGGTIQDAVGNDAVLTLPAPGAAGSLGDNKDLVIDGAAPSYTATWLDDDGDGKIDQLRLDFNSDVSITDNTTGDDFDAFTIAGFVVIEVAGLNASGANFGSISAVSSIVLAIAPIPRTSSPTGVSITYNESADEDITADGSGLSLADGQAPDSFIDGALPVLVSAETGDNNENGEIDRIFLTFSEVLEGDGTSVLLTDFAVAGYTITNVSTRAPGSNDDDEITIRLDESGGPDTDATPVLTVTSGMLQDLNSNLFGGSSGSVTDAAHPVIYSTQWEDDDGNGNLDRAILTFSEDVDITDNGGGADGLTCIVLDGTTGDQLDGQNFTTSVSNSITINFLNNELNSTNINNREIAYVAQLSPGNTSNDFIVGSADGLEIPNGSESASYVDLIPPNISRVFTVDHNLNGRIDSVTIIMSENFNDLGIDISDFSITGGYTLNGDLTVATPQIRLGIDEITSGFDTDVTFDLSIDASILQDQSLQLNDNLAETVTVSDGVAAYSLVTANTTSNNNPALAGEIDDGAAKVLVSVGSNIVSAVNNGDGTWDLPAGSLTNTLDIDTYDVLLTTIDPFGNVGNDVSANELTITPGVIVTPPPLESLCNGFDFVTIGEIVIEEVTPNGIANAGSLVLSLPSGYEFNTSALPPTNVGSFNDVSIANVGFIGANSLSLELNNDLTGNQIDVIRIRELEVRATGSIPRTPASMLRSGGDLEISLNASTSFASFQSNNPIAAPTVENLETMETISSLRIDPGGTVSLNITSSGGTTDTWYNADFSDMVNDPLGVTGITQGNLNTLSGVNLNNRGIYQLFAATSDGSACEGITEFLIGVFEISISGGDTEFAANDPTETITARVPVGFTPSFSGPGLGVLNFSGGASCSIPFTAAAAGEGSHEIQYILENADGLRFVYSQTFNVSSSTTDIFTSVVEPEYCADITDVDLDARVSNLNNSIVFVGFRCPDCPSGALSQPSGYTPPPSAPISVFSSIRRFIGPAGNNLRHGTTNNWSFDPKASGPGTFTIQRIVGRIGNLTTSTVAAGEVEITVNPLPTVTLQDPSPETSNEFCEKGGIVNIFREIVGETSDNTEEVPEYSIERLSSGDIEVIESSELDLENPLGNGTEAPGDYRITYTSEPSEDPNGNGCTADSQNDITFTILPTPNRPTLANDLDKIGELVADEYLLEFCVGDELPDLEATVGIPADEIIWYSDPLRANTIPNGNLGDEVFAWKTSFFGQNVFTSAQSFDLYFSITPFRGPNTAACESELRKVQVRIYDPGDAPQLDISSATPENVFVNANRDIYFFEYCLDEGATLTSSIADDVVFNTTLPNSKTYFRIFDKDTNVVDTIRYNTQPANSFDPVDPLGPNESLGFNFTVPTGETKVTHTFHISRRLNDNKLLDAGAQFSGCEGPLTQINYVIYTNPEVPDFADFTGDPHDVNGDGSVVQYYMCRNDNSELPLDIGITAPASADNFKYDWFTTSSGGTPIDTEDPDGERISLTDLNSIGFDESSATQSTTTLYVSLRTDINETTEYQGCTTSGRREVRITVFPDSNEPTITATPNSPNPTTDPNFDLTFSYCIDAGTGFPEDEILRSTANYTGALENEILWFRANDVGSETLGNVPEGSTLGDITAAELNIGGIENDSRYFGVIHRADFISTYDGFEGCFSDTVWVRVNVNTIPEPSMRIDGITAGEPTIFRLFDDNASIIGTNGVAFELRDASNTVVESRVQSTLDEITYTISNSGTYTASLSITSEVGCDFFIERTFQVLDKLIVTGTYSEDFEDDNGGWFAEYQTNDGLEGEVDAPVRQNSWTWGSKTNASDPEIVNFTSGADGTSNAWHTGTSTYVGGEESYVYSPSFDLTALINPALSFYSFRSLDSFRDGVVMQYSADNGATWVNIGNYDPSQAVPSTGNNWYTDNGISSAPGDFNVGWGAGTGTDYNGNNVGWAGQNSKATQEWRLSVHALEFRDDDNLANIRFRFALGASGADTDDKEGLGFSFDEMSIYQLDRNVLVEQFSSTLKTASKVANDAIHGIAPEVLMINYFTGLFNAGSDIDDLNKRNTAAPSARSAFYGVDQVPSSVLDGELYPFADVLTWNQADIEVKTIQPTRFNLPLGARGVAITNNGVDDGRITGNVRFVYQDVIADELDLLFHVAIVEKKISLADILAVDPGFNPGAYVASTDTLRNVLRTMLPSPAGTPYQGNVDLGQSFDVPFDWEITNVFAPDELRVIAFVQNKETGEILQSGWAEVTGKSSTVLSVGDSFDDIVVYPNPANAEVKISMGSPVVDKTDWTVYDQSGREVLLGQVAKGTQSFTVNTADIPSGIYMIHFKNEREVLAVRRILVTH